MNWTMSLIFQIHYLGKAPALNESEDLPSTIYDNLRKKGAMYMKIYLSVADRAWSISARNSLNAHFLAGQSEPSGKILLGLLLEHAVQVGTLPDLEFMRLNSKHSMYDPHLL